MKPAAAMILAAGRGERMRPLSDHTPKPLLHVAGQPLIAHQLHKLAALGLDEVVINTAWLAEQLHQQLGDGSAFGLLIHYSDEGKQALETAGGIARALPLLHGDPLLVINGDVWCDLDFGALSLAENDLAQLVLVENPAHHPDGDFALRDGRVGNHADQQLTFAGIGLYRRALFSGLPRAAQPLAPLLRSAIEAGRVGGLQHRGDWCDVGTPERLQALNARR